MGEWLVRLEGDKFDLEELADHFTSADWNVKRDEDGYYYLKSSDFNDMIDSHEVHERALELIGIMNGAASYRSGGGFRPVEFDGLTEIDANGRRHNYVFLSTVVRGRSRVIGKPTVRRANETIDVTQVPSEVETLANLADRNEKVADALRFCERGDWINLYKAWEVVCDAAGGSHAVVNNGWADDDERRRFTGTAQSRNELGDEARHASERYRVPRDPMTLDEARGFVRSAIQAWISTL